MKKVLSIVVLFVTALFLVSCDKYENINKENYLEVLSNLEIDDSLLGEIKFNFNYKDESKEYVLDDVFRESKTNVKIDLNGKFLKDELNSNLLINTKNYYKSTTGDESNTEESMNVNVYLTDQILYMNLVNYEENDVTLVNSKIKINLKYIFELIGSVGLFPTPGLEVPSIDNDLIEKLFDFLNEYTGFELKQSGNKIKLVFKANQELLTENIDILHTMIKMINPEITKEELLDEIASEMGKFNLDFEVNFINNVLSNLKAEIFFKEEISLKNIYELKEINMKLTVNTKKGKLPKFPDFSAYIDIFPVYEEDHS